MEGRQEYYLSLDATPVTHTFFNISITLAKYNKMFIFNLIYFTIYSSIHKASIAEH